MALCSASRSSDLSRLSVNHVKFFPSRTVFLPTGLAKQSRSTHLPQEISFSKFEDPNLCPVDCLQQYLVVTSAFRCRSEDNSWVPDRLFLSISKPHNPVMPSTIARWLKSVLSSAGVDTTLFSAHSTRGASASKAAMSGVTLQTILHTADWSSAGTFKKFYYRREGPGRVQSRQDYSTAILHVPASNSRCDMESEPSNMQS